ncbi:hypothetical protein [Loigolactobacillus binensis]|uniref:Uncharacterized protein n=1 Tax=Loigolactobacillus binensis TaxID=2559922 RepID=A0ABW3E7N7_9LACO|nr:hypothetical protein [Loigolactobacillus binensis]
MNTKKHILQVAVGATLMFGVIYLLSILGIIYGSLSNISSTVSLLIVLLILIAVFTSFKLTGKQSRKAKWLDLNEDSYPADMEHNDEREWRMMLTATYISLRILIGFISLALVPIIIVAYAGISVNGSLVLLYALSVLTLALLIQEWCYVLVYWHLDR